MNRYSNLFKRSQALVLAIAMVLSMMNLGLWLNVAAAETETTMTQGEIIAQNYNELTDAEKALLKSGNLPAETVTFVAPTDSGLVEVDNENHTIEAESYKDSHGNTWNPVTATVKPNTGDAQTVVLTDGKGTYSPCGNAFSVEVTYELWISIDKAQQESLLGTAAILKQGAANVAALDTNALAVLEMAMPMLADVAKNGYDITFNGVSYPTMINDQSIVDAILRLDDQRTKNGGSLDMTVMLNEYNQYKYPDQYPDASYVKYLLFKGNEMRAEVEALTADVAKISKFAGDILSGASLGIQVESDLVSLVNTLNENLGAWGTAAEPVIADEWAAAAMGTALVADTADYKELDELVADLADVTLAEITEIKNPLWVADAIVTVNMSMYVVTVDVVLKTVGANNEVAVYDTVSTELTLAEDATADDVLAAIEAAGVIDAAKTKWAGVLDDTHFDTATSELPENLGDDVTYTVTFTPKEYKVTDWDGEVKAYPYGYLLTLPKCETAGQDYDYFVNGNKVAEGTKYQITEETVITREAGKAYTSGNLNQIISDRYFEDGGKADSILTSGALLVSDVVVSVRYPDNEGKIVSLDGDKLTAKPYASGYNNLNWMPYSYSVVVNGEAQEPVLFAEGETEATVDESVFDRVEVEYRLALTNISDEEVLELLNLPKVLADEAAAQKAVLDNLYNNYYGTMGQLGRTELGALTGVIKYSDLHTDPAKNEALKTYFNTVLDSLINTCVDSNNMLKLYNKLTEYKSGGLVYYYQNSEAVLNEVAVLTEYLSAMIGDESTLAADEVELTSEEKLEALTTLVKAAGYPEYADKIPQIESALVTVKNNLTAPNAAIDVESDNLSKLVDALTAEGELASYTDAADGAYLVSNPLIVEADNKKTVSVTVQIDGGKSVTVNKTFDRLNADGEVVAISQADVDAFIAEIEAKIAELGVDDKYYTNNLDLSAIEAMAGKYITELDQTSFTYTWALKTFEVTVNGTVNEVTKDYLTVKLPASENPQYRYDYYINGSDTKHESNTYTLTLAELDAYLAGEFTFDVKVVDVSRENLTEMVNGMNEAAGSAAEVVLMQNADGKYSIVLKVNSTDVNKIMNAAMQMMTAGYSYIGIGGHDMLYPVGNDTQISLQAVVDAIMESGFGTDTVVKVIDANGKINHMTLDGIVYSNADPDQLGGELIKTSLQLGNGSADNAMDVDFYVTLGTAPSALVEVRNLLAGRVGNYVSAVCEDGIAKVDMVLPGKAYEAALAALLVTGNTDFDSIGDVNAEIAIGYVIELIDPLFAENVTTTTLTNTLNKLGYDLDLTSYESLYRAFCEVYGNCEFTYDAKTAMVTGNVDVNALLDKALGDNILKSLIVEYRNEGEEAEGNGINFNAQLTVDNLGDEYDALYIDLDTSDLTNASGTKAKLIALSEMAGLTNDFANVSSMTGYGIVVLLDDVDADLVFNGKATILDLNGHSVKSVTANGGGLIIVDSAMDPENPGEVGTVSGNATVIAGKYGSDVTEFIKNSYVQDEDGVVSNEYYTLVKDADGNITVQIDAAVLNADELPNLQVVAIDLVTEVILNGYTANSLTVDGNKVYDITLDDLLNILTGSNRTANVLGQAVEMLDSEALTALVNTVLDDLADFEALYTAISGDEPILTYDFETGAWNIELVHNEEEDYLTANIISDDTNKKTGKINVVVVGSEDDKQALADLVFALAETATVNVDVDLKHALEGKDLVFDWTVTTADVVFDYSSNPDYAIMYCVLIADGIGAPHNTGLIRGINAFYETGSMELLQDEFNKLTTAQIITAVNNFSKNDSFLTMVKTLGLEGVVADSVIALEETYDAVGKIAAKVVRTIGITGGSTKTESYLTDEFTYSASKENIDKTVSREILRGYGVTLNAAIEKATVTVEIFNSEEIAPPVFINDHTGNPVVSTDNDIIYGYSVNLDEMMIIIDAIPDGISAEVLESVLSLTAENSDAQEFTYENLSADGKVATGTVVTVKATNQYLDADVYFDEVTYTIVMLGDVNKDGETDAFDAALVAQHLVGLSETELDELQLIAADINRNINEDRPDGIDIGDATVIVKKRNDWVNYETRLAD